MEDLAELFDWITVEPRSVYVYMCVITAKIIMK